MSTNPPSLKLSEPLPREAPQRQPSIARITTAEYEALIEAGVLGEDRRVELLSGIIVDQMPKGTRHDYALNELMLLVVERLAGRNDMRTESPIELGEAGMPEPDLWIAAAPRGTYKARKPTGSELLLVVEVADSSLEIDREVKLPLYAAAGIPEYWIVNLRDASLERYTEPRPDGAYAAKATMGAGQSLAHELLGEVAVGDLV